MNILSASRLFENIAIKISCWFNGGRICKFFYSISDFIKNVHYFLFPEANNVKSSILPKDDVPFNVKYLYISFQMLEDHVEKFNIRRISQDDEYVEENWNSYEQFEDEIELSNEIIDLYEWWIDRKEKSLDAGIEDVTMRIEEDQMLIRLAKIRHRIYWHVSSRSWE